jgi:putative DNA methylase
MSTPTDKRLIEDYLPIEAISAESSREKSVRKGHISTLHLWWARRPLVACRAAVYGALVPASRFVPNAASDGKKKSLGRANAAKFVERLCKYPGDPKVIAEAQQHILDAHAERLTRETGMPVTVEDIQAGQAPRPKVLDMFAGGGSIPLEALRLGCEAYALDLNPVAHIIQLCTLVYPQKYGKPDPSVRGMTGPKNECGETTWGGLAKEVRYWGDWVLRKVKAEIGDLYPLIPDPGHKGDRKSQKTMPLASDDVPPGYLVPVAHLWTRTVICKNPACRSTVSLLRQTWLCKKKDRYVALRLLAPQNATRSLFEVVESKTQKTLGFSPEAGSKGGNATCPFCGTVASSEYIMAEGCAGRMSDQLMAVVCTRPGSKGRLYISGDQCKELVEASSDYQVRLSEIRTQSGLSVPNEPISSRRPSPNSRGMSPITRYGFDRFGKLFTNRQMLCLLQYCIALDAARLEMLRMGIDARAALPLVTECACALDRIADQSSSFVPWLSTLEAVSHTFPRHAIAMLWDYVEVNPLAQAGGSWMGAIEWVCAAIEQAEKCNALGNVTRGSATRLPHEDGLFDAVVTDPPYYDNVPYADISDFFYVWLKRSIGGLYPDHFGSELTPKKSEATSLASRHAGDMRVATKEYEAAMLQSFREAHRVLKDHGTIVTVYAHKTTLGWSTLVDAMRKAGFTVTEAWPLNTERSVRVIAQHTASLASSIFLVGRKRDQNTTGSYESEVQPELESIVRERVDTLWDQGISGADLVIACVGAGLRAFTRFARVEYANGDEVPAERFLTEVETVVLDSILGRLSKEVGGNGGSTSLAGVDPATRFYTLWRYTYRGAELDAGEAIIFANGTHVELDGPSGLSSGARALVEKKKGKYRLRDYTERGDDETLGLPTAAGQSASLIDTLHRTLWLMENRPLKMAEFLREMDADRDQMRLVAQALAGPALKGGEMTDISPTGEMAALAKLTANWRSVVEDNAMTQTEQADRKRGQGKLFE